MASTGVVREFHPAEGWGVIDAADMPGDCWVHFSVIAMTGFRQLSAGQTVSVEAEPASQDGFDFRAVKVWTGTVEPGDTTPETPPSAAYRSELTLTFDPPADPDGPDSPRGALPGQEQGHRQR